MVIFVDRQSLDKIKRMRGGQPAHYVETRLEDFRVYPHREMFIAQGLANWPGYNPRARLVFCEKPNFLARAAQMNPFHSEYLFWCDIGAFRHERLCGENGIFRLSREVEWPNLAVCRHALSDGDRDRILLIGRHLTRAQRKASMHPHAIGVGGLFFGGPVAQCRPFCEAFYRAFDERVAHGRQLIEEPILRDLHLIRPDLTRVVYIDRIRWLRWLTFPHPPQQFWWYFLNGRRFPWHYFRRHFTLPQLCAAGAAGILPRIRKGRLYRRFRRTPASQST